ncbi:MAG: GIY-YIG nuclease family protein [Candidatus Absconditabacteria bacterium]|nr:GIY-YIG nuclease family protein [Candidatus Absconditabacteria bacterium]MDD3868065.1 GIY-YIG nuclease family protein [Candidatus Absconditabacteria bacterium]MDD4714312.1 GIY-YIG nuclease family protein [Candidatus Absconditabacteria bacterium]
MKKGHVYMMTNHKHGTLYVGVTSNLEQRIYQHKTKYFSGFSAKYGLDILIWFQEYSTIQDAIHEEKRLKGGSRKQKIELIEEINPYWEDLGTSLDSV